MRARSGKRVLKTGDFLLLVAGAVLVALLFHRFVFSAASGKSVEITAGPVKSRFDIGTDRTVPVEGPLGTTTVVIEGGAVRVEDSPCRDKLCVQMGRKRRAGEQIICLPNRVVVEVIGNGLEIDAVSR